MGKPGDPARPGNTVVIHVDDLGWRDLGCMGSPVYETPNIDRLAQSGTLFTDAYAAGSLCTPSRACMLTGSQPSRHGVYTVVKNRGKKEDWKVIPEKNSHYLAEDYPTLGTVLTGAGIANGTVGKWHIGVRVPSHGFREGKWGGCLGMPINYFAPSKLPFLPGDVPGGSYLPTYIREAGVAFLERHRDERFFLYFSTYLPHDEIKNEDGSTLTAPLRGQKGTLYEGGIRAPMIASMPGRVAAGRVCDEPVSGIDFHPTICSFMGLEATTSR
jgi:arylsulfatase A-like enzyme